MRRLIPAALIAIVSGCAAQPSQPHAFAVYFESNKASLTPDARAIVDQAAIAAQAELPYRIVVEGGATGGSPHDASLAAERADAVIQALVAAHIDPSTIDRQTVLVEPPAPIILDRVAAHKVQIELVPAALYARQPTRSSPSANGPDIAAQPAER